MVVGCSGSPLDSGAHRQFRFLHDDTLASLLEINRKALDLCILAFADINCLQILAITAHISGDIPL